MSDEFTNSRIQCAFTRCVHGDFKTVHMTVKTKNMAVRLLDTTKKRIHFISHISERILNFFIRDDIFMFYFI